MKFDGNVVGNYYEDWFFAIVAVEQVHRKVKSVVSERSKPQFDRQAQS